jgi:hypothetical protein
MFEWLLFGLVTATIIVPPASQAVHGQDDRASGSIVIDGDTIALRHVLARKVPDFWDKDKIVTQVLVTAERVPEEALEDGFTLLEAVRTGRVTGVRVEYEADGRSVTGHMLSSRLAGDLSVSRSGSNVRPAVFTASRIDGSFESTNRDLDGTPVQVNVTWSARVQAMPVVAEPTAADAAAALQHPAVLAWQAIEKAIHSGDKAALLKVAPAQIREMANQPDFAEGFKMMKDMTPKVARYLRVTEKFGKTIIEAEAPGLMDNQLKRGTITMVKDDAGVWWVDTMTF